jgi:hypothetical protein
MIATDGRAENKVFTVLLARFEVEMSAKRLEKQANWPLTSPNVADTGRRKWRGDLAKNV